MSAILIAITAGIIMGFSLDNVVKLLPEEITSKKDRSSSFPTREE